MNRTAAVPKKSIFQKSRERSRAKKKLNRNFTAGDVVPNEHYLNHAGLRGRKRWVCLCLFVLIYLIAVAHLVLTCLILGILRFTETGPSSFVFKSSGDLVWSQGANITDVRLAKPSTIRAYNELPLGFYGDQDNEVTFQASLSGDTGSVSQLRVTDASVNFEPYDSLYLHSSVSGEQLLFVNSTYTHLAGFTQLQRLHTTQITTNRLKMRGESALESSQRVALRGAAGVFIGGSRVEITSGGGSITLSAETNIQLEGRDGVTLPTLPSSTTPPPGTNQTSHLCACRNGRLFLVPQNPLGCAAALNPVPSLCT